MTSLFADQRGAEGGLEMVATSSRLGGVLVAGHKGIAGDPPWSRCSGWKREFAASLSVSRSTAARRKVVVQQGSEETEAESTPKGLEAWIDVRSEGELERP